MKKVLSGILIGFCVFITVMIIVSTILRFIATNSIGDSFFEIKTLTEAISLFAILGAVLLDIILIGLTIFICCKSRKKL